MTGRVIGRLLEGREHEDPRGPWQSRHAREEFETSHIAKVGVDHHNGWLIGDDLMIREQDEKEGVRIRMNHNMIGMGEGM